MVDGPKPTLKGLAAIIDIDGTVCEVNGRAPLNYDDVSQDLPRSDVIRVVRSLTRTGFITPFFVTGRPERCRQQTREWLRKHLGEYPEHLVMRHEGDRNQNSEFKRRAYETLIAPGWTVVAVFEDNPKASLMYRSFGLEVFQIFNEKWGNTDVQ
jgi:hypothetical protein